MNPIPIAILVFSVGAVCLFVGVLIGAGLTVMGLTAEKYRARKGMWQMLEDGKRCIQEFFDCPTIQKKFKVLSKLYKDGNNWYEIRVVKIIPGRTGLSRYISGTTTITDVEMRWYE